MRNDIPAIVQPKEPRGRESRIACNSDEKPLGVAVYLTAEELAEFGMNPGGRRRCGGDCGERRCLSHPDQLEPVMISATTIRERSGDPVTIFGSVTIYGNFNTRKPYTVRCMATSTLLRMADDRRGLLTPREREILSGEADVTEEYYYSVVSRVRSKIQKVEEDAQLLREHNSDLFEELAESVTGESDENDDE